MEQATLSVRMDKNLKKAFDDFCANVGMNASTAVNIFARAVIRERRIPFEVREQAKTGYTEEEDGPFWNEENQRRLRKAMADAKAGKFAVTKTLAELKAMENA